MYCSSPVRCCPLSHVKGTERQEKFFSLIKVPQTFDYFGKDGKAK